MNFLPFLCRMDMDETHLWMNNLNRGLLNLQSPRLNQLEKLIRGLWDIKLQEGRNVSPDKAVKVLEKLLEKVRGRPLG